MEGILCVRHCVKCCPQSVPFNPPQHPSEAIITPMSQVEAEQGEPSQRGAGPVLEPQSPSLGDSGQQSGPLISPALPLYERERLHVGCSSASALSASASA